MLYHLAGTISSALFLLCIVGYWLQLQKIYARRQIVERLAGENPSAVLSLNRLLSGFFAFWVVAFFGLAITPIDLYIACSRLVAVLLVAVILYEVARDRKDRSSQLALGLAAAGLAALLLPILISGPGRESLRQLLQWMLVVITVVLVQGYVHQVRSIMRNRSAGAVCTQTHWTLLAKDLSTMAFVLVMGPIGWPLLLLTGASFACQLMILYVLKMYSAAPEGA